jgi:hypothetical protein
VRRVSSSRMRRAVWTSFSSISSTAATRFDADVTLRRIKDGTLGPHDPIRENRCPEPA